MDHLYNCNSQVKALCNRAMACGHTMCHKKKKPSLFPGLVINIFFKLLGVVTDSREGITIQATGVEWKTTKNTSYATI